MLNSISTVLQMTWDFASGIWRLPVIKGGSQTQGPPIPFGGSSVQPFFKEFTCGTLCSYPHAEPFQDASQARMDLLSTSWENGRSISHPWCSLQCEYLLEQHICKFWSRPIAEMLIMQQNICKHCLQCNSVYATIYRMNWVQTRELELQEAELAESLNLSHVGRGKGPHASKVSALAPTPWSSNT